MFIESVLAFDSPFGAERWQIAFKTEIQNIIIIIHWYREPWDCSYYY